MFKRLYAIGAHEDLFPPMRRTRFSPRFGTASTKAWYRQYHTVVLRVPHRGTESTTPWYSNQSHIAHWRTCLPSIVHTLKRNEEQ